MVMSLWIEVLNKRREKREDDVKMLWGGGEVVWV